MMMADWRQWWNVSVLQRSSRRKYFGTPSQRLFVITVTNHVCPCGPYHQIHFKMNRSEVLSRISRQQHPTHFCINYLWVHLKPLKHNGVPSWTPSRKQMLWPVCTCLYIPGRNFRSNCRNYRRALLLFEMDVANPPSPVQIEAICFSRSKAKNWFYLNEPLENMQKHRVFWVLLINYDNFSGKLTRIVHFCAKLCKKPCAFNSFWTFDSMFDHKWIWSLSKLCSVQHCKAGWARPVFSILGKDKRDPNETVFCSLDVSLRSPLQSSPIK